MNDQLRHGIRHADGELRHAAGWTAFQRADELAADCEDLVGISIDHASDFGRDNTATLALEQLFAERLFEHADLGADRRLRQTQALGGA